VIEYKTVRDLAGQKLSFRNNNNRPGLRYLYFLFILAQLKMAWRCRHQNYPARKPLLLKRGF